MRICCPCSGEEMVMKFCHAEYFKIYDVDMEEVKILAKSEILNNSENHEEVALMLKDLGVDTVVCALIGEHGVSTLNKVGIEVFAGVKGDLDSIIQAFIGNEIQLLHNTPTHTHGHEGCCHHEHEEEGCCCHHEHEEECGCDEHEEGCCCHHHHE